MSDLLTELIQFMRRADISPNAVFIAKGDYKGIRQQQKNKALVRRLKTI